MDTVPIGTAAGGGLLLEQTVHTEDVQHAATHRCDVTFFADSAGVVTRWEYTGCRCSWDIEKPKDQRTPAAAKSGIHIQEQGGSTLETRWIFAFALAAILMAVNGQTGAAGVRAGTIVDLQRIENRGDDESVKTKKGRMIGGKLGGVLGGLVGSRMVGSDNKVVSIAGGSTMTGGEAIGSELAAKAAGPGATTRFMVKVKLDSGKMLTVTQFSQQIAGAQEWQPGTRGRATGTMP